MAIFFVVNKRFVDIGLKIERFDLFYFLFLSGMLTIRQNVNLKPYNTFGIEAFCNYFVEIKHENDFLSLLENPVYAQNNKLILGGGSNLLFTKNFNGLVIKNCLKGIQVVSETEEEVVVCVAAGEVWHEFVLWCIDRNYSGLENLSLIPGCVGASPMQNIGAYGVEIKETFVELKALSMSDGSTRVFTKAECEFGYRESVFKHQYKNQYFIASVTFSLQKQASLNTSYGAINAELQAMGITQPGIKDVSKAVINIRQSKLPDPKVTGNAGSFFKNPEVSEEKFKRLKAEFPELVAYPLTGGKFKLAAGWLIEQCGLKGYEMNGAAVHLRQALVIINKDNCRGEDVFNLSGVVMQKVNEKFGVELEREVNIV